MPLGTVTNSLKDAYGNALAGKPVLIELHPAGFRVFAADGHEVAQHCPPLTTDASGNWSATLEQNAGFDVANMHYKVIENHGPGGLIETIFDVPSGTHTLATVAYPPASLPSLPPPSGAATVTSLVSSGSITSATTISATELDGKVRDKGGQLTDAYGYGFRVGSGAAAANSALLTTWLAAAYAAAGGWLDFADPGDYYFSSRVVLPNSTGGSYIGAIGSAVPMQPLYRITGRHTNGLGQNGTRLFLQYNSSNPTSSTASITDSLAHGSGSITGIITATSFGTTIPLGSLAVGSAVTVYDSVAAQQEAAVVTSLVDDGTNITSITFTGALTGYHTAVTLSWPLRNDCKLVTLGRGLLEIGGLAFCTTTASDKTPFWLTTNTEIQIIGDVEIRGIQAASDFWPYSLHTNQWPTQDGILFGGVRAAIDGSISSACQSYTGVSHRVWFYALRSAVRYGTYATTMRLRDSYVTASCGDNSNLGAAIVSDTAGAVANSAVSIHHNQIELPNYQYGARLGNNTVGYRVSPNQYPDNLARVKLSGNYTAAGASLVLYGYLPTVGTAPYLKSREYAVDHGPSTEYCRFTTMTATASTTLSAAAAVGDSTIEVASAASMTALAPGSGLLLSAAGSAGFVPAGTYGGVPGAADIQEPAYVTAIGTPGAGPHGGTVVTLAAPLVYSHPSGGTRTVLIGPWTGTLQTALAFNHSTGADVSPCVAAVRCDVGATRNRIGGTSDGGRLCRDLNATPGNSWDDEGGTSADGYHIAPFLEIGANPAQSGGLRLGNTTAIRWRNGGGTPNTVDIGIAPDVNDNIAITMRAAGNVVYPATDAIYDLGTASFRWRSLYVSDSVVNKVVAGAVADGSFNVAVNGMIGIDSTNGRFYFRYGGAWHYVTQTA